VAYSFLDTPESVHRALAAGADAFLAKDSTPEQWIRAVEDVLATGFHFNAYVTRALLRAIREGPPRTEPHHQWERLTEREREFLLTYTRKGMESLQQVARAMGVKRSTVETHRKAVARKCEAPKRADMVRLVLENGWGKGKK
jgi:DNA-binding NarL/FixJ family response regulator